MQQQRKNIHKGTKKKKEKKLPATLAMRHQQKTRRAVENRGVTPVFYHLYFTVSGPACHSAPPHHIHQPGGEAGA